MTKKFFDLRIWIKSHELTLEVYRCVKDFPNCKKFGISSQLRRSSSSVGANIAEATGRYHHRDKTRFFYLARGSLRETQNFILLAKDLGYVDKEKAGKLLSDFEGLAIGINLMINSIKSK